MDQLPELKTERLTLSAPRALDIPYILEYNESPVIARNLLTFPYPYLESDAVSWINLSNDGCKSGDHYIFAIRSNIDQRLIGGIGLSLTKQFNRAEIGYWLAEQYWGKGYGTEAAKALIRFGFETLGLNKITSAHSPGNPASGKIMQKNGMVLEGQLSEHILKDGEYLDVNAYGLTKKQFDLL